MFSLFWILDFVQIFVYFLLKIINTPQNQKNPNIWEKNDSLKGCNFKVI